jgi:hypothetical protein
MLKERDQNQRIVKKVMKGYSDMAIIQQHVIHDPRFCGRQDWQIEVCEAMDLVRGDDFGTSNGGDVMMMAIAPFSFGTSGDSKKLQLTKCK